MIAEVAQAQTAPKRLGALIRAAASHREPLSAPQLRRIEPRKALPLCSNHLGGRAAARPRKRHRGRACLQPICQSRIFDRPSEPRNAPCDCGYRLETPRDCRCRRRRGGGRHAGCAVVPHPGRRRCAMRSPRKSTRSPGSTRCCAATSSVSLFPSGTVTFHNVVLGDDGNRRAGVVADELTAHLRYFPLLAGRIEIADVTLVRPTISVTFLPGGQSNWSGLIQSLARALAARPRAQGVILGDRHPGRHRHHPQSICRQGTSSTSSTASNSSSPGRRSRAASAPMAASSGTTSRSRRASRSAISSRR